MEVWLIIVVVVIGWALWQFRWRDNPGKRDEDNERMQKASRGIESMSRSEKLDQAIRLAGDGAQKAGKVAEQANEEGWLLIFLGGVTAVFLFLFRVFAMIFKGVWRIVFRTKKS